MTTPWNRCDACGEFIAFEDFERVARRVLVTPDSEFSKEEYETLCISCTDTERRQKERTQ